MNPAILIQVRLKSQRCGMKALRLINGKPLLQVLLDRLSPVPLQKIICTSTNKQDDLLSNWFKLQDAYEMYRGSEENIAERLFECASLYEIDPIIRVTGDNPMTDPDLIIKLMGYYDDGVDYVYPITGVKGVKSEIIRPSVLPRMFELQGQEQIFSTWLKDNTRSVGVPHAIKYTSYTCDTEEDLENIRQEYGHRPISY